MLLRLFKSCVFFMIDCTKCRSKGKDTHLNNVVQNPNSVSIVVNNSDICCTSISKTTMRPASVVIIACSSLPERESTRLRTATIIPIAAILKINSTPAVITSPFRSESLLQALRQMFPEFCTTAFFHRFLFSKQKGAVLFCQAEKLFSLPLRCCPLPRHNQQNR